MKKFILLTVLSLFISTSVWAGSEEPDECDKKRSAIMKKIEKKCTIPMSKDFSYFEYKENNQKENACLKAELIVQIDQAFNPEEAAKTKKFLDEAENSVLGFYWMRFNEHKGIDSPGTLDRVLNDGAWTPVLKDMLESVILNTACGY